MAAPLLDQKKLDAEALMKALGSTTAADEDGFGTPSYEKAETPIGGDDPTVATSPVSHTMTPPAVSDPVAPTIATPAVSDPLPAATTATTQPSVFKGFTPKHAMEGFNFDREQDTGKSAKDAFAFLANQAPPPPLNDKAALGAWFKQYIEPGMNQLGHNVSSVDGDKFHFKNWQGDFDVDYGRGAGADGGALAWQVDDPTAQPTGAAAPTGDGAAQQIGAQQGDTSIDRLMAEIAALTNGDQSPMDANALMKILEI